MGDRFAGPGTYGRRFRACPAEKLQGFCDDMVGGNAEMAVEVSGRCRGTEACHPDESTVGAHPTVPAEAARRLDGDARCISEDLPMIGRVLSLELLPARHGDHRRCYAFFGLQALRCGNGDLDFGSRGEKRDVPVAARLPQDIGPERR